MKNLYITDLDKTLLRSNLTVSGYSVKIWNTLAEQNIKLTVATARSAPKTLELLKDLKLYHPLIVMDGAMIISPEGEILLCNALHKAITQEILACGRRFDLEPFVIGLDADGTERFRYGKTNRLQQTLLHEYRNDKRLQHVSSLNALYENVKIVYIDQKELLEGLYEVLHETFGDAIEIKFAKDPYIDGYFLTILHPHGDKAHALQKLLEMGYDDLKITAFGDSHNDIGMFEIAHRKIAVANAVEELKAVATDVLPHTNDEDGVARYLQGRYELQ